MKRLVKICKFITNCRHKEKCAYKHIIDTNIKNMDGKDKLAALEKTVKLLDYKTKSEAKINSLEKEVKSLKTTNFNENKTKRSNLPQVESISN